MLDILCVWSYRAFYPSTGESKAVPRSLIAEWHDDIKQYADNHQCYLVRTNRYDNELVLMFNHDFATEVMHPIYLRSCQRESTDDTFAVWAKPLEIPAEIHAIFEKLGIKCMTKEQYSAKNEQEWMEHYRKS